MFIQVLINLFHDVLYFDLKAYICLQSIFHSLCDLEVTMVPADGGLSIDELVRDFLRFIIVILEFCLIGIFSTITLFDVLIIAK